MEKARSKRLLWDGGMVKARRAKKKIRVMVADREAIFRFGLKKLFALEDDLRIAAEADKTADVWGTWEPFARIWPSFRRKSTLRVAPS